MAPGPDGHRSPPAQGHVVGESLIAHGNAITQGEKCGVNISHGQCRRSCECALHDEAVSKGKNLNCVSCLISQTCFWRGWLWGTRYWGWTLSPAGKVFTAYVYSGPPYRKMTKKKTWWQLAVCLQCLKLIYNRAEIQSRHNLKQDYGEILIMLCLVPPTVSDRNITVVNTKRRSITIIRGNIHSNFKQNSFHHNSVMCWKRLSWS